MSFRVPTSGVSDVNDQVGVDPEHAIRFVGVSKDFGSGAHSVHAVRDVSLDVVSGGVQGVIGYSGAGKSTLIRMVNGLEIPTSGRVWVEGSQVSAARGKALRDLRKTTAMIFQHFNLLETLTVAQNVALPLMLDGVDSATRTSRTREVLDFVGLGDRADHHPAQLSGGQKQRVGIARALTRNPSILLCDEATSALDPATTAQIVSLLRRVNAELGTTILVVTHEMDVIKDLCDRVAVMEDGRIIERGDVMDIFTAPTHPTTERFVETVVPRRPPSSLIEQPAEGEVWTLVYSGEEAGRPLLSRLVSEVGVEFNILAATVTEIHAQPVGYMVVRVTGSADALERGRAELADHGVFATIQHEEEAGR